jgi:hypothetical protein
MRLPLPTWIRKIFGISSKDCAQKRESASAGTFAGMNYDELTDFASTHRAPQEWYEEDVKHLRGSAR